MQLPLCHSLVRLPRGAAIRDPEIFFSTSPAHFVQGLIILPAISYPVFIFA